VSPERSGQLAERGLVDLDPGFDGGHDGSPSVV
jgi:hypothetical protein